MAADAGQINILAMLVKHLKEEWVMWPILLLSVAMITITIERIIAVFVERFQFSPNKFLERFSLALQRHNGDKMLAVGESAAAIEKKNGVCATIIKTVFHKYQDGVEKRMDPFSIKQWMRTAAEEQSVIEMPALEAHLGWLAIISNVATLMGLFGTVYGMIAAFTAMSQAVGGVKADEMAGGIAVALIATLFGLFVAIPALLIYNFLKNFIEAHLLRIENAVTSLIDTLAE